MAILKNLSVIIFYLSALFLVSCSTEDDGSDDESDPKIVTHVEYRNHVETIPPYTILDASFADETAWAVLEDEWGVYKFDKSVNDYNWGVYRLEKNSSISAGSFHSVFAVNDQVVYLGTEVATFLSDTMEYKSSSAALVYKTINGGETWERVYNRSDLHITFGKMFFVNEMVGYAVSNRVENLSSIHNRVTMTKDGGLTWSTSAVDDENSTHLSDVAFIDENIGFATGTTNRTNSYNVTFRTQDGGATWSLLERYDTENGAHLNIGGDIEIVNGVVFIGDGYIFRSDDGGLSWDLRSNLDEENIIRHNTETLYFIDENEGYSFGRNLGDEFNVGARIIHTKDGGLTWEKVIFDDDPIRLPPEGFDTPIDVKFMENGQDVMAVGKSYFSNLFFYTRQEY